MKAVRVMNVLPTLLCGGTEKQVMMLTRALKTDGFDVEFACLRRWGPFVDELRELAIPLTEYDVQSFWSGRALAQQARFARDVARNHVQIVHSYNFYGNVFAVPPARLAGIPVVVASIRDCGPYLTPLQKRVQRYACRLADCVLVNAAAVKEHLIDDGYDPARIVVIPNGVDLRRFERPADSEWLRREFGFSPAAPIVAVVSRLVRLKGLDHFIAAAAIVAQRSPDARFLIVGEANPSQRDYRVELEALVRRLGLQERVIFTGARDDIPALLASVTVSVMPSLNEALSNSLLESMAAGAPVVATRVGATPEALREGELGLLVPPADASALADAISTLLENRDLAARVSAEARQSVAERYSVHRMVSATEELYQKLLEAKTRVSRPRRSAVAEDETLPLSS